MPSDQWKLFEIQDLTFEQILSTYKIMAVPADGLE